MDKQTAFIYVLSILLFFHNGVAEASELKIADKAISLYSAVQEQSVAITTITGIVGIMISVFGLVLYFVTKSFGHQVLLIGIAIIAGSAFIYYILNNLGPRLLIL